MLTESPIGWRASSTPSDWSLPEDREHAPQKLFNTARQSPPYKNPTPSETPQQPSADKLPTESPKWQKIVAKVTETLYPNCCYWFALNYRFIKESARAVPTANAEPIAPAAPHSPTHVPALAEVNPTTFSQIPSSNFSPFVRMQMPRQLPMSQQLLLQIRLLQINCFWNTEIVFTSQFNIIEFKLDAHLANTNFRVSN